MTIRLCKCGNPIDMSEENVAECEAICELAIRHVEDALMLAKKAILEQAQDIAEQSWTVYFDLEDSGSYILQDGQLFREEEGGTYTAVGRVRKGSTN